MHKAFFITLLFLTACSVQAAPASQVTPTVTPLLFATATLRPTSTPRPSATVAQPTIALTIVPINAILTNPVNIRSEPDTSAQSLGLLNYGNGVQIIGKDNSGSWWQIIYPDKSSSTGWVWAAYAQVSDADAGKIPVVKPAVDLSPAPTSQQSTTQVSPTTELSPTPPAHTAKVKNQIFVRSGPGQSFDSVGTVNAGTIVTLIGRNQNNMWAQITFVAGKDGKGWVAAAYLDGADFSGLPYFDSQGNLMANGTSQAPAGQQTMTPTPYPPAAADGDSQENPAVRLNFSPDGVREFTYSSDLSSPTGDPTDWVAFTPYEPTNQSTYLYLKLTCSGNGGITATLEKDGVPVPGAKPLVCGNYDFAIQVQGGKEYMLVLNADGSSGLLRYIKYDLFISSVR